jgi:hypothetical protein
MSIPTSAFYTEESRWLMGQLLFLESGTENGGMYANKAGYHNTRKANLKTNYSVVDTVDKEGPDDKAAAYDWTFASAQAGRYDRIAHYTSLLLKSAKDMDDPRLNGWREFYGQADNDTAVEGWDTRYGVPASSDPSHLWHIHFSETRGLVNNHANKVALLSVLKGETVAQWKGVVKDVPKLFILTDSVPKDKVCITGGAGYMWLETGAQTNAVMLEWGLPFPTKRVTLAQAIALYGPDLATLRVPGPVGPEGPAGPATLAPHTHDYIVTITDGGTTGPAK